MAGNAPNQFKNTDLHIRDSQQTLNRKKYRKVFIQTHHSKNTERKKKILKAARYKRTTIRLTAYFSS